MDRKKVRNLENLVKNRIGILQKKLSRKFQVLQSTISRTLKQCHMTCRKRRDAPKATPPQEAERVQILDNVLLRNFDMKNLVQDDESYFTPDGVSMLGNVGFYAKCAGDAPFSIRFKERSKFAKRVLVWVVISPIAKSEIHVCKNHTVSGPVSKTILQKQLLPFLDKHYDSQGRCSFLARWCNCTLFSCGVGISGVLTKEIQRKRPRTKCSYSSKVRLH